MPKRTELIDDELYRPYTGLKCLDNAQVEAVDDRFAPVKDT